MLLKDKVALITAGASGMGRAGAERFAAEGAHVIVVDFNEANAAETVDGFDSVVLACGSVSDSGLYDTLKPRLGSVHVLGDAYAPRRLVFATKQAYALAELLVRS